MLVYRMHAAREPTLVQCRTELACVLQQLGGARYMFLTHLDDVADHMKWASALGCERIIHESDATDQQQTT